ncbi:MAG: sulfatase [Gemmatimonadota bacterium]|nr:sulfatase [Gemmatimonadota bacterium]
MNLIVLCSDTFRVDHLSGYRDDSPVRTPHIDRLAEEGVRFDSAFGEGIPTLPARRVLYTGRPIFPFLWAPQKWDRVQLAGWHPLFHEDVTLAEWLVDRGYVTGLISDLPHQFKPGKNFHRGFVQFNWERGQEMDYAVAGPRDAVPFESFDPTGRGSPVLTQFLMNSRDWKDETDWCSVRVLRKGIEFLRENARQQPFMLWLECFFPHEPWFAPPELVEQHYEGDDHDGVEWIFPPASTEGMSENQVHRVRAHYRGLCALIDRWFGRLMETAEDLGLLENSIVVFLSDHGTMMGEQGQLHKGPSRLRWQCTQVPLIIRHPDVDAFGGSVVDAFVQHQDLMPTLLGLMGIDAPDRCLGEDLRKYVTDETEGGPDHVTTAFGNYASVRSRKWNYQTPWVKNNPASADGNAQPLAPPELYDLTSDPDELHNVAADHPDVAEAYHDLLMYHIRKNKPVTGGSLEVGEAALSHVPLFDQSRL